MEFSIDKPKKGKKIIKRIIIAIFVLIVMSGSIYIGMSLSGGKASSEAQNVIEEIKIDETKVTETKTARMLKLEELQKVNSDVVAYIQIEGTNISYPVLQTKDNDYYMTRTYKKKYSKDGSLFLDKDYDWSIPSSNLLIYGHNNSNDKMFAELMKYKKEAFYKKHKIIKFTTNKEDAEYEIIAAFESRAYYKSEKNVFRYYFFINAKNKTEYNSYVNNSLKSSLYKTGKTATYGDQLLTLSTCSYHVKDGRFVVVARK